MNPVLAAGQLIVSIALTFAVLLQSRGSGLGGTFGGDPRSTAAAAASSGGCGSSRSS